MAFGPRSLQSLETATIAGPFVAIRSRARFSQSVALQAGPGLELTGLLTSELRKDV
jgi:hypothetical protein